MAGRNTTRRDRHRATIAQAKPPCAICGSPIDYTLRWPHPDTLSNKQPAHHRCNREKSNKPVSGILRASGVLQ